MHFDAGDAKARHSRLPRAEHLTFAPQAQVFLGDTESILGFAHDLETRLSGFAKRCPVEEDTSRPLGATTDAAPQLVELREPKALRMLDHHHGRLRHVHAHLDDGGGNEEPRLAASETIHGAVFVRAT